MGHTFKRRERKPIYKAAVKVYKKKKLKKCENCGKKLLGYHHRLCQRCWDKFHRTTDLNKRAQLDFDEINVVGIIFGLIGAGIGIIVSKSMGSGVVWRLVAALVCAVSCYLIGSKIADG